MLAQSRFEKTKGRLCQWVERLLQVEYRKVLDDMLVFAYRLGIIVFVLETSCGSFFSNIFMLHCDLYRKINQ